MTSHIQSKDCWCQPTVEIVEGQDVFLHNDPGLGNPPISYSQEEYDEVVAERDQARLYEKHNAVKLIALRAAVNRYLRFLRTGEHANDDDSLLSLLDDIESAIGYGTEPRRTPTGDGGTQ